MRDLTLGNLRTRILGGGGEGGAGSGLTVVLLHGFGARGDDLVPLAHFLELPPETTFVFPEAPIALPGVFGDLGTWWPIDVMGLERALASGPLREPTALEPAGVAEARARVADFLGALEEELEVAPGQMVLGGFSQGAMVALDTALRDQRDYAALVLLSCTLLCEEDWNRLATARRGLRVFQSHGRDDQLLDVALARRLRSLLVEAELEVEWHEFDGGHDVPAEVQRALGAFLRATRASAARGR